MVYTHQRFDTGPLAHAGRWRLFPRCVNLKTATGTELKEVFGDWPLPVKGEVNVYRR